MPKVKLPIPFWSYLSRSWVLLIATFILLCVPLWNHAFKWIPIGKDEWGNTVWQAMTLFDLCGAPVYVPGVCLLVWWVSGLAISLYFRQTIDADASNGTYVRDWQALTSSERVLYSTILRAATLIAMALAAAAIVK